MTAPDTRSYIVEIDPREGPDLAINRILLKWGPRFRDVGLDASDILWCLCHCSSEDPRIDEYLEPFCEGVEKIDPIKP